MDILSALPADVRKLVLAAIAGASIHTCYGRTLSQVWRPSVHPRSIGELSNALIALHRQLGLLEDDFTRDIYAWSLRALVPPGAILDLCRLGRLLTGNAGGLTGAAILDATHASLHSEVHARSWKVEKDHRGDIAEGHYFELGCTLSSGAPQFAWIVAAEKESASRQALERMISLDQPAWLRGNTGIQTYVSNKRPSGTSVITAPAVSEPAKRQKTTTELQSALDLSAQEHTADQLLQGRVIGHLREYCKTKGWVLLNVPADGSCFYTVLAAHLRLYGKSETAQQLRAVAKELMKTLPDDGSQVERDTEDNCADQAEILALSSRFCVPIEVHSVTLDSPSTTPKVMVSSLFTNANGGKPLKLGRIEYPRPTAKRPFQHYLWIVTKQLNKKAIAALGKEHVN